jgi:tRNA (uracil-5-)-methyltransferase TRM9
VYVWAIEQDELSKRSIAVNETGQDVFVPWVLSEPRTNGTNRHDLEPATTGEQLVFNRYYHMFAHGELTELVRKAARELGLHVGTRDDGSERKVRGLEIVQDGWERSNYFVELRCWERW